MIFIISWIIIGLVAFFIQTYYNIKNGHGVAISCIVEAIGCCLLGYIAFIMILSAIGENIYIIKPREDDEK
jgi:hypothetical protein